jgi:rhodanese-related sulfurtransferase
MNARKFLSALAISAAVCASAQAKVTPEALEGVKTVTAEQVKDLQGKGVPVIDTRVPAEFAEKSIKGAISVPYKEKSAKDVGFDRGQDSFDLSKLPGDKAAPVIFYCNSGECWKSYKASVVARDAGYRHVLWFRGGMPEWSSKGLPTQ